MGFKERGKILKQINYLDLHPVRLVESTIDENGLMTLLIPKFENKFFVKYFLPLLKSRNVKLKLDELGSAAWELIDGAKSVEQILVELSEKFGDKIQPVEERLTKFLTQLYEQRIITFEEIKGV